MKTLPLLSDALLGVSRADVTVEQLDVMRHALGASHPKSPLGWRNYYAGDAEGDPVCESLVALGLMVKGPAPTRKEECQFYSVTDEGKRFCGVKP